MFEDHRDDAMAKEVTITFRCTEPQRDWLYAKSGALDKSVSDVVRAAVLLAVPQMLAIRGLDRVQLEDIRGAEKNP